MRFFTRFLEGILRQLERRSVYMRINSKGILYIILLLLVFFTFYFFRYQTFSGGDHAYMVNRLTGHVSWVNPRYTQAVKNH